MATDFAVFLHRFLVSYLAGVRGCSASTITAYSDAFKLLIGWFASQQQVPPEKLTLDHIDAAAVTGFLAWLETSRGNSPSTRNARRAAITSFFRWLQSAEPVRMAACQEILAIPPKKQAEPGVPHLTLAQTRRLLAAPDLSTRRGRRDATLLATLYETAARVSEAAGLDVRDIRLEPPALAVLTGKGDKTRQVPVGANAAAMLAAYLAENRLDEPGRRDHPLFSNHSHTRLTRGGIAWIVAKYHARANGPEPDTPCHPHILRHSRAMHLLESGVSLPYIRDLLGHTDLATTQIYARASAELKRKALEAATEIVSADLPDWNDNPELLTWLNSL